VLVLVIVIDPYKKAKSDFAVTRVKERPGFPIRNKFKSSNDEMNETESRFEFSSSNIRSLSSFRFQSEFVGQAHRLPAPSKTFDHEHEHDYGAPVLPRLIWR
jgi:hypothetical protein